MAEQVVTFTGPKQMDPNHQRKVIDLLFMELDLEIVHIKDDVYKIRRRTSTASDAESAARDKRTSKLKSAKKRK